MLTTIRFFEFKAMFGGNLICGFGRLFGQLTGFLVNSGPITAGDSQKGGHFVQVNIGNTLIITTYTRVTLHCSIQC